MVGVIGLCGCIIFEIFVVKNGIIFLDVFFFFVVVRYVSGGICSYIIDTFTLVFLNMFLFCNMCEILLLLFGCVYVFL